MRWCLFLASFFSKLIHVWTMSSTSSKYLTADSHTTSRIPVKSASTSLPRRTLTTSTSTNTTISSRQKTSITPAALTLKPSKSNIKQRATTTPQVHRRRTSSTSSNASSSSNWLTSIFSSNSTPMAKKKRVKSVIKLSVEKDSCDWQLESDQTLRYLGPKSNKKFEFGMCQPCHLFCKDAMLKHVYVPVDHIFRASSTNRHLFDSSVKSTIQDVMLGLNGTNQETLLLLLANKYSNEIKLIYRHSLHLRSTRNRKILCKSYERNTHALKSYFFDGLIVIKPFSFLFFSRME